MKRILPFVVLLIVLSSHDMFLKLDNFFLKPNSDSVIQLLNGTFERSENVITRDRMLDVSLVGMGYRTEMDTSFWYEDDSTTYLRISTGEAGTYMAGVSTAARNIEMDAEAFNGYLEHDGVLDMLEWRKENNAMDQPAVEKYSKHVKTIFQVGEELTDDWNVELGYPIEFVPLENPYDTHPGHDFQVKLLWQGEPLKDQLVYVGYKEGGHGHSHDHDHDHDHSHDHGDEHHSHDDHDHSHEGEHSHDDGHTHSHDEDHDHSHDSGEHTHEDGSTHSHDHDEEGHDGHTHDSVMQLRTDANGVVSVPLSAKGVWFLRTIYMELKSEDGLTHESNWATLTFAVGDGLGHTHDHSHDEHEHDHEDEGIPSYVFWVGSFILLGILFFWFNRKKS